MLLYILKSIFCLFLFLGFYHLVLEKEKMHRFNRFYLLGSIVFAFIVPSFTITVITPTEFIEPVVQEFQMIEQMQTSDVVFVEETEINYMNYVYGLYIIVSGILCFFFIKNLHKILSKTKKNEKVSYYDATVILLKEKILPHTFLKYIFINKNEYTNDQQEQLILTHELAHVKQKHSIDVLFIELLQIVFWCIPVFKLYKKAIQLNHEFLADDAVIKSHKNISEYQHILLNTSAQNNNIYLASNLNYSLTKKRLLMMTTPSSKTKILLKKLMVVPLTAGFIFAFAQRVEAQENKNIPQIVEVKEELQNENELLIFIKKDGKLNIKNQIVAYSNLKKVLNKEIKNIDKASIILKTDPNAPLRFSNLTKIKNALRQNGIYSINFENFVVSPKDKIIIKNKSWSSKTVRPQVIEVIEQKKKVSEKEMNEYKIIFKKVKSSQLVKETESIWMLRTYKRMSSKQKQTVENLYKYIPKDFFSKRKKPQVIEIKTEGNGISDEEMNEYNTLIGKAKTSRIFKYKDLNRMKALYKKMSKKQQNSVEDVFELAPPLPRITYKKKTPTTTQFNSWKNNQKFALWIDNKVVENSILNNYKNTDFSYFSGSKVYKNARSKRFPQEYQFNLYTHSFFAKMKEKEAQESKNIVTILINKKGQLLVKNNAVSLDNLVKFLNKNIDNKRKAHIIIKTDKATKKEDLLKVKNVLRENRFYKISINSKLLPPPPPIDLVYTYNRLAKRIQSTSKNRKANVIYLKELYRKMNASQKRQVTKPSRVLPPPPPKPVKIEVIKNEKRPKVIEIIETPIKEVQEVIEVREIIEVKEDIDEKEVEEVIEVRELIELKEVVEVEERELIEEKEVVEVLKSDPRKIDNKVRIATLLKYIKKLDRKGAKFSFNNKKISYKKAKFLIRKKGIQNIYAQENKDKTITVKLSDIPFIKEI